MSETNDILNLPNNHSPLYSSDMKLKREVKKMYEIRLMNYLFSFIELLLSTFICVFYLIKISRQARRINWHILVDKYHPNRKDLLLNGLISLNKKMLPNGILLLINNIIPSRIIFISSFRHSFYGNLDLDSIIKKFCCYICCCCCQIGCIKIFIIIYFFENLLLWIYHIYLHCQYWKYYSIDNYLDNELDTLLNSFKIYLLLSFIKLFLYLILVYCLNFTDYFLKRTEIYLEYYKILIEENLMKEANEVRFLLGHISKNKEIEDKVVTELQEL